MNDKINIQFKDDVKSVLIWAGIFGIVFISVYFIGELIA